MSKTKTPSVAELREQAKAAGINVPAKANKATIEGLLAAPPSDNPTTDKPDPNTDPAPANDGQEQATSETVAEPDAPKPGERRPIPRFTDRGDWQDPFVDTSEYLVFHADTVSEATGAVRDGDEAVYPDAA